MKALRPALQQVVEEWSCFHRDLRDVTLHTTRVRCAFQHQQAPLFLLKQAEGYVDFLLVSLVGEPLYPTVCIQSYKKNNHMLYFILTIIILISLTCQFLKALYICQC